MSLVPAADILVDFSQSGRGGDQLAGPQQQAPSADAGADAAGKAYSRGFAEGSSAARNEAAEKLRQLSADHQERLELERRSWAQSFAGDFEIALLSGLQEVEATIGRMTAQVLKPFLSTALRRRAIEELAAMLKPLLSARSGLSFEFHGPEDLMQLLSAALAPRLDDVSFHPAAGRDLRVTFGRTTLETRLAAWAKELDEALK